MGPDQTRQNRLFLETQGAGSKLLYLYCYYHFISTSYFRTPTLFKQFVTLYSILQHRQFAVPPHAQWNPTHCQCPANAVNPAAHAAAIGG